ncbi:MAG: radical SAM protein [Candidatus Parcubacteria bacterium]|nr:radical SAM protein [Candidatus Parcubacteria bacterium]
MLKKLEIFTTFKCNNDCIFCVQKENREKYKNLKIFGGKEDAMKILKQYLDKGYNYINFLGGEPFSEPSFIVILRHAKKLNFVTALATNGCYLADSKIAKESLPLIDELIVSIYGHNQELISKQSRNPQLYGKLVKACKNINKYFKGRLLKANCVINRYNYKYLLNIIKFINKCQIKEVNFTSMEIQGHNKKYAVEFKLIKDQLQKAVEYGLKNRMIVRFSEIPFCVLGENYCFADELFTMPRDIYNHHNKIEKHGRPKERLPECKICEIENICPGIDSKYIKLFVKLI